MFHILYVSCSYESHIPFCHKYFIKYSKPVHSQVITNVKWHIKKIHGYFKYEFKKKSLTRLLWSLLEIDFSKKNIQQILSAPFLSACYERSINRDCSGYLGHSAHDGLFSSVCVSLISRGFIQDWSTKWKDFSLFCWAFHTARPLMSF